MQSVLGMLTVAEEFCFCCLTFCPIQNSNFKSLLLIQIFEFQEFSFDVFLSNFCHMVYPRIWVQNLEDIFEFVLAERGRENQQSIFLQLESVPDEVVTKIEVLNSCYLGIHSSKVKEIHSTTYIRRSYYCPPLVFFVSSISLHCNYDRKVILSRTNIILMIYKNTSALVCKFPHFEDTKRVHNISDLFPCLR